MCELMALSFESPISADFSIREFAARGDENPDGWGLGWYPDQSLAIVKEPVKWGASHYAGFLSSYARIESRIHIAHVRHKTVGDEPSHADTHPFSREVGGRDYCFAHNGTLEGPIWDLPLGDHRPMGRTDSEQFFCHLLGRIKAWGPLDTRAAWERLYEFLAEANRMGKLNVLLSDGRRLFCYHDLGGWKGLNFRKVRIGADEIRHFGDETLSLDLDTDATNRGFVVATCPLSAVGWHTFHRGELIVFEQGAIRYSSHRGHDSHEFGPASAVAGLGSSPAGAR
ncbi:class II glutamine amidotransferase [Tundrisphaera sp. TA3]|uniref:class II glutamine amidotransferase n=1 Tax=Tundrisphaera sp. TA3 TaxID=3435775 RepID=UPI003EB69CD3